VGLAWWMEYKDHGDHADGMVFRLHACFLSLA